MRRVAREFRYWPDDAGRRPMERRIKHSWLGERVRYYQRFAGRWKRVRDSHEPVQLWESPGAIAVFTEFDLPSPGRSLRERSQI